jgi:hypothetical protein
MKSEGTVYFHLDPDNPPVLTEEERRAWEELKAIPDEAIDFSDIPPQTDGGWRRVSELVPAEKQSKVV